MQSDNFLRGRFGSCNISSLRKVTSSSLRIAIVSSKLESSVRAQVLHSAGFPGGLWEFSKISGANMDPE